MRTAILKICLLTLMLSPVAYASDSVEALDSLRWDARVLLVFAPDAGDPRLTSFAESIDAARCEVDDRDLVLGKILQDGDSHIGDTSITEREAALLREKARIGDSDFRILLIGKDGGVKATYRDIPDLNAIFDLIDGMPMRRQEIRNQSDSC